MCFITSCCNIQLMLPPSIGFLASRSNFQQIMPCASPLCICSNIWLKIGRPGSLADWDSYSGLPIISSPSRLANFFSSSICESIDKTCRSSDSEDLRAYRKYLIFVGLFSIEPKRGDLVAQPLIPRGIVLLADHPFKGNNAKQKPREYYVVIGNGINISYFYRNNYSSCLYCWI